MVKLHAAVMKLQTVVASVQQTVRASFQMVLKLQKNRSTSGTHAHSPSPPRVPNAHFANPTVSCASSLEEIVGMWAVGRRRDVSSVT